MNYTQILSKNIKVIRGSRSQANFAKELGITKSTVQAMEKGETAPRLDTVNIICERLHLTISELFSEDCAAKHLDLMRLLARGLDCYERLPKQTQKTVTAWLRGTADLLDEVSKQSEGT